MTLAIPLDPQDLPFDILPPILEQLANRADWHACSLVSRNFNRVATPLLYHTLDSRIISKTLVYHPSTTLNRRPELAQYVRRVTETGAVHRGLRPQYPHITEDTLAALSHCTNLESLTWIDDSSTPTSILLEFLTVTRRLPLRELTIRTHSDLGEPVWAQLVTLTGLRKVSIWCMEGPPRVLQGWSTALGETLTHLELGRCAGVPPTILITVLSQLPRLKDLRLKGAPSTSIPTILTFLPNLQSLDTDYLLSGSYYPRRHQSLPGESAYSAPPMPALRSLTVRTSSMDTMGPQKLWGWIRELLPEPSLETFRLHAFTINMGQTSIPRMFILDLAVVHKDTLKHFIVGDAHLTLKDVECLCSKFPRLETLACSVASPDVPSIESAIRNAQNLTTLQLQVHWLPNEGTRGSARFTSAHAKELMLRGDNSRLRLIGMGQVLYTGKWILQNGEPKFEVMANVAEDKWHT